MMTRTASSVFRIFLSVATLVALSIPIIEAAQDIDAQIPGLGELPDLRVLDSWGPVGRWGAHPRQLQGGAITGPNLTDCARGISLQNTHDTLITGCRVARSSPGAPDIEVDVASRDIELSGNRCSGMQMVAPAALAE